MAEPQSTRPALDPWLLWIVGAALALRAVVAAHSSIYVDEAFTWFISRSDFSGMLLGSRNDLNPPAWYFLMHPLCASTRGVFWLRAPAFLCATGSVALTGLLSARLCSRPVSRAAALLLALAYGCWLVDTQIRVYGLMMLLVALSLWLFVQTVDRGEPPGGWVPYGALCLCLPLFHYLGVFSAVALIGAAAVAPVKVRARLLAVQSLSLVPGLVWIGFIALGSQSRLHPHHADMTAFIHALTLPEYLTGIALPLAWQSVPAASTWGSAGLQWGQILVNACLWGAVGWGALHLWNTHRPAAMALVLLVVVPLLGLCLGASLGIQPYQNRYGVPAAGPFYILLCTGLFAARVGLLAWVLVLINLVTGILYPARPFLWNQNWIAVSQFVELREKPGDHVAAYIDYSLMGFDYYYRQGQVTALFGFDGSVSFQGLTDVGQVLLSPPVLSPELDKSLGGGHVFLILNQEDPVGGQEVRRWFKERYGRLEDFHQASLHTWGDITVYELERRGVADKRN